MKVRKAVFPVAGLGTRFLPATKALPKEMLPVVDRPLIQYGVEEAAAAGIELVVFVVGRTKNAILDHFDKAYELESELERRGKRELLEQLREIPPSHIECAYVRQAEALGLGHAVLCARPLIGEEPFAVLLPDDLIVNPKGPGCLEQLVQIYRERGCSVVAVEEIPREASRSYGVVAVREEPAPVAEITAIVEKPSPEEAPSNLGVVGRYVLSPAIFELLERCGRGAGGEIQLTDAISSLLSSEPVLACRFAGKRYDCGSKLGYLQANIELALARSELGEPLRRYLRSLTL